MRLDVVNHTSHKDAPVVSIHDLVGVQLLHVANHWPGSSAVVKDLNLQGFYIELVDDIPEAPGALGYHSIDSLGRPFSRVAVNPSLQNGSDWLTGQYSVVSVVGHEAMETMGNPIVNVVREITQTKTTPQELCDAVQDTGYRHGGADLSNFLYPSWFNPFGKAPFDYSGVLTHPFTLSKGGYMVVTTEGTSKEVFGEAVPEWKKAARGRRALLLG